MLPRDCYTADDVFGTRDCKCTAENMLVMFRNGNDCRITRIHQKDIGEMNLSFETDFI